MIKAFGKTESGRSVLALGVEEKNLKQLRKGNPIQIFKEQMEGMLPFDVIIFYGKDHAELMEMIGPRITDDTMIHREGQKKQ